MYIPAAYCEKDRKLVYFKAVTGVVDGYDAVNDIFIEYSKSMDKYLNCIRCRINPKALLKLAQDADKRNQYNDNEIKDEKFGIDLYKSIIVDDSDGKAAIKSMFKKR